MTMFAKSAIRLKILMTPLLGKISLKDLYLIREGGND